MFSLLLQGLNYSKQLEGFKYIFVTLLLSTYLLVFICTEDERPLFAPQYSSVKTAGIEVHSTTKVPLRYTEHVARRHDR
jgi:hypothetical protein